MKNLSTITSCVDVTSENNENDEDVDSEKVQNIAHVFCLAHVSQLALQTFLNFVRVNSINVELQKTEMIKRISKQSFKLTRICL